MSEKEVVLKQVREAFLNWRATRMGKGFIPEELFELAARLVSLSDLSFVARELGLNRGRLAQGIEELKSKKRSFSKIASPPTPEVVPPEGLHFSRIDSFLPPDSLAAAAPVQNSSRVHAQLHFGKGIVVSLCSLASVRILCQEAVRQGGG